MVGVERDPHARLDLKRVILDQKRLFKSCAQRRGHLVRVRLIGSWQEDGELVTTKPGEGCLGADRLTQAQPDLSQQQIATLMPEGVVDLFEALEVEHEQGHV